MNKTTPQRAAFTIDLKTVTVFCCLSYGFCSAAVVSIDIDNGTGVQTQIGEAPHTDGLTILGQEGDWFSLAVPDTGGVNAPATATPLSIDTGSGVFTLSAGVKNFTSGGATVALRRDVAYWTTGSLTWSLTGLVDGAGYNVLLFGGVGSGDNPANATDFSIDGYDPGSGVGGNVVLDDDFDGYFTNVIATGGAISGTMTQTGVFGAVAGIQFEQVTEEEVFEISAIEYFGGVSPSVTLTWPKTGAVSYDVRFSLDLIDWEKSLDAEVEEGDDENSEDAENMTVTFPLTGELIGAAAAFFRVEE